MDNYFNINIEFDRDKVNNTIQDAIERGIAGYVCSVDGNNLVSANENPTHREAINGAVVNLCDSAWIPLFVNCIYKTHYKNYTGADLFLEYVNRKQYRQFFLGSTPEVLEGLKKQLTKIDPAIAGMKFETLPFGEVPDFNYPKIAQMINDGNPDIIWISLGAPKQEQFMYNLKPFLKKGVMFGFGAIFNFNSGISEYKRAPRWIIRLRLEWLFRTFQEPRRMAKRYWHVAVSWPELIRSERKKIRDLPEM
jgi:N-acetylglucosaminyldiphosphoundecaprenol N-acetyl-beta-D-mannosaminyltransferase